VWRGTVTASLGEITIEPFKEPEGWKPREKIDEKALGLDEIRLPEPQGP